MTKKIKHLATVGLTILTLVVTSSSLALAQGSDDATGVLIEARGRTAEGEAPKGQDNSVVSSTVSNSSVSSTVSSNSREDIKRENKRIDQADDKNINKRIERIINRRMERKANRANRIENRRIDRMRRIRERTHSNSSEQNNKSDISVRRRIRFSGDAINGETPKGRADFRILPRNRGERLNVSVQNVNLADGTSLDVNACGSKVGTISLRLGRGEVSIKERNGDLVPTCSAGGIVTVSQGTNTIVSGTF